MTAARYLPISLLAGASLLASRGDAAPGLLDTFDGPTTAWRQPENPAATRIVLHERTRSERRGQSVGAEHLRFTCPTGYSGVFLYPVGRAPVLEEQRIELRYRGSAAGAILAARVVFPRSSTPDGQPVLTVVRAEPRYETAGEWAELRVEQLPLLVKRQARLLRASPTTAALDERGAYVDSVVLIVPGGPQGSEFWVEQLSMDGVVTGPASEPTKSATQGPTPILADQRTPAMRTPGNPATPPATQDRSPKAVEEVRITSGGFRQGDRSLFPRIWSSVGESAGENFEVVRESGFSAVSVDKTPQPAQQARALEQGLLFVCPPPDLDESAATDDAAVQGVLAWSLPGAVDEHALDGLRPRVASLRQQSTLSTRPLLASPSQGFAAWSRLVDGLVVRHKPTGESFAAARSRAIPGTALLARVPATRDPAAQDQLHAFAPVGKSHPWRSAEQIESLVWSAIADGARGVWLTSDKPLNGVRPSDQAAAAAIELLNLKLALVEPWIATGVPEGVVLDPTGRAIGAKFARGRAELVVGYASGSADHGAADRGDAPPLVLPAVSETASIYELSPAGLSPVAGRRTLGGIAIDAQAIGPGRFLLVTDDRRVAADIRMRVASGAKRAVTLQQSLLLAEIAEVESAVEALPGPYRVGLAAAVSQARTTLSRSKASQTAGASDAAYRSATSGRQLLATAGDRFHAWLTAEEPLASSPLTVLTSTWSDEVRLRQLIAGAPRSSNLLGGGDFEDLAKLRALGWRHTAAADGDRVDPAGDDQTLVELSGDNPKHGGRCLTVHGRGAKRGDSLRPAAWVTSPATQVGAGQLLEITGWVRFKEIEPGNGSLAVVDSLGGEELAVRIDKPCDWTRFRLLRRPTEPTRLRIGFVLSGSGVASIDAVMVRPISFSRPNAPSANPPAADATRSARAHPRAAPPPQTK